MQMRIDASAAVDASQAYYVYENWARNRCRVHHASCTNCNDGAGIQARDTGETGRWLGPYREKAYAFRIARSLGRSDTRPCMKCLS